MTKKRTHGAPYYVRWAVVDLMGAALNLDCAARADSVAWGIIGLVVCIGLAVTATQNLTRAIAAGDSK